MWITLEVKLQLKTSILLKNILERSKINFINKQKQWVSFLIYLFAILLYHIPECIIRYNYECHKISKWYIERVIVWQLTPTDKPFIWTPPKEFTAKEFERFSKESWYSHCKMTSKRIWLPSLNLSNIFCKFLFFKSNFFSIVSLFKHQCFLLLFHGRLGSKRSTFVSEKYIFVLFSLLVFNIFIFILCV